MYKNIIPSNMLFKDLNENEIEKALNLFSSVKRKYSKGENIASAGTRLEKFGLVLSGTVQVSFIDIDGNSVIMASVTKGDTFGESLCWLNISEIPVTVTAFTDVEVLLLSPQSLSSSTDALALELKNRFVSMLATKALAMNDRIQILSKPTVRQKIITFLSQ